MSYWKGFVIENIFNAYWKFYTYIRTTLNNKVLIKKMLLLQIVWLLRYWKRKYSANYKYIFLAISNNQLPDISAMANRKYLMIIIRKPNTRILCRKENRINSNSNKPWRCCIMPPSWVGTILQNKHEWNKICRAERTMSNLTSLLK